jgi:hypothetical protein
MVSAVARKIRHSANLDICQFGVCPYCRLELSLYYYADLYRTGLVQQRRNAHNGVFAGLAGEVLSEARMPMCSFIA